MENTELKIYKKLYEINSSIVRSIHSICKNRMEYRDKVDADKKEEKDLQVIIPLGDKSKWEYYGICSKQTMEMVSFLEYLLDDNATEPENVPSQTKGLR